jgi:hypothetical protein
MWQPITRESSLAHRDEPHIPTTVLLRQLPGLPSCVDDVQYLVIDPEFQRFRLEIASSPAHGVGRSRLADGWRY